MKKTLLALAVLGAFAGVAHAQSSVTISGNVDMGYQSYSDDQNRDTNGIERDGSSTSTLIFSGTEDLGSGLKAGFLLQTNLNMNEKDTNFLNAQNYLSLGGNFGTFQLGNVNSNIMAASSTSQPFGTATGSAYSGNFSRLDGLAVSATAADSGASRRVIRTGKSIYYTSPSFSGFEVSAGMAFENDEGTNANGMLELALSYKGNGLNVILAHYKTTAGNTAAGGVAANGDVSQTALGANYQFGPATVYAGYTKSDSSTGALSGDTVDSSSYNIAGKYAITPAVALMANFVRINDDSAAGNEDRELFGLGVDYSLSKRTTAYARYEKGDNDKSVTTEGFNRYALGLRHSF
jgi:predicted porin